MRAPKLDYTTYIPKLTSMANLHQSKSVSVVRRNGCDKAVGTSGCEGRSARVEGHLCHSNLLLGPLNGPSSFPCNHLDCSLALLAPALPETETLSSPFVPGIFIELVNQQQLPQGSSWHNRQGTRVGSCQDSGTMSQGQLPPPWDCRYWPRYPTCSQQPGSCHALGVLPWCSAWRRAREDAAGVSHPGLQNRRRAGCIYRRQIRFFH